MSLSRDFGLGQSGLGAAFGLGGAGLGLAAGGAAPIPIIDAVNACGYSESERQNNPEDISGGIRVDWYWKEDGSRVWMNREDRTDQYDVDPPWSLLGADWGSRKTVSGGSVNYQLGGIHWTPDGTRMMTLGSSVVGHVDMGTAFDISTAGTEVLKFVTPSLNKFHWTDDGLTVYIYLAGATKHIVQYAVAEAFNVSTLNNIAQPFFDYSSDVASLVSMTLSADGRFVFGAQGTSGNEMVSWELTTPFDITTATNFCVGPQIDFFSQMTDPRVIFYRRDTGDILFAGHLKSGAANQRVRRYSPSAAVDITDFSAASYSGDISASAVDPNGVFVDESGTRAFIVSGSPGNDLDSYSMSTPFDLATLSAVASVSAGSSPIGVFLKPDGTKLFRTNFGSPLGISEFTLSTPWDITTAGAATVFLTSPDGATIPFGLHFSSDGLNVYTSDNGGNLFQWSLAAPWDISSPTFIGSFDFTNEIVATKAQDLSLSNDGTKLYLPDLNVAVDSEVFEYGLSVPFDITTAFFTDKIFTLTGRIGMSGFHMLDANDRFYAAYNGDAGGADPEALEEFTI